MRYRRRLALPASLVAALLIAGCASSDGGQDGAPSPDGEDPTAGAAAGAAGGTTGWPRPDRLTISVEQTPGAVRVYTLSCRPPRGSHPAPRLACDALATAKNLAVDSVPDGATCEALPFEERAEITGVWAGSQVRWTFDRSDTCQAERWGEVSVVLEPFAMVESGPEAGLLD